MSVSDKPTQVELLGRKHTIVLPGFAEREECVVLWTQIDFKQGMIRNLRRYAAAIGLCTRIGRESGQTLAEHNYDMMSYGGAVYSWLRENGAEPVDLRQPGESCMSACNDSLFPRKIEVDAEVKNSEGPTES